MHVDQKKHRGSVATVHSNNCVGILPHALSLNCKTLKRALRINVMIHFMVLNIKTLSARPVIEKLLH